MNAAGWVVAGEGRKDSRDPKDTVAVDNRQGAAGDRLALTVWLRWHNGQG